MNQVWVDGRLLEAEAPAISAFDHALLTGDGVFETLRVYRGEVFAPRRHLQRLARSAAGLGLSSPSPALLRQAMGETIEANALVDGRLRLTVTGGPSPLGSARGSATPTTIVAVSAVEAWPSSTDIVTVPWPRNERSAVAGLKTVSYAENVVALAWAQDRGAGEAVFANLAGNLCEGTGSNVFVVIGGGSGRASQAGVPRLVTPPLSAGCLAGVTRELVLELVEAYEDDIPIEALSEATEAFLTSSTREIQPVRAIDGRVLAAAPGPATRVAMEAFTRLVARDLDP